MIELHKSLHFKIVPNAYEKRPLPGERARFAKYDILMCYFPPDDNNIHDDSAYNYITTIEAVDLSDWISGDLLSLARSGNTVYLDARSVSVKVVRNGSG
jgi:hypothetical protein